MTTFTFAAAIPLQYIKGQLITLPAHEVDPAERQSLLNTPVLGGVEFLPGNWTDYKTDGSTEVVEYAGLKVDTCMVFMSQRKNIVKTEVLGRPGSVKEYISRSDYNIQIVGSIVGSSMAYPEQDVQALRSIMESPEAITIDNRLLRIFDVDTIAVEGFQVTPREGFNNLQDFSIRATSDSDFILELEDLAEL